MRKTIDWEKIWSKFDDWWQMSSSGPGNCGMFIHWDEQQAKIQQLVNDQVREIMEKKT